MVRVFVTSTWYSGDFAEVHQDGSGDGLAGADAVCQERADSQSLGGTWTAWLSTTEVDALARIPDGRYELLDGTLVAEDKDDLTDGNLNAPINLNEYGLTNSNSVWTSTRPDGTADANFNCSNWTSNGGGQGCSSDEDPDCGRIGLVQADTFEWTLIRSPQNCSQFWSIYCFGTTP